MGLLEPYILSLKQLKADIPKIAGEIVLEKAWEIMNIVKYSQLGEGKNSDDQLLEWEKGSGRYALSTQEYWQKVDHPNKPKTAGEPYNFDWTGGTFAFMDLEIKGKGIFEIFTKDGKRALLESTYGRIFDLTETHNIWVNENIILPNLYKYIAKNMFNV